MSTDWALVVIAVQLINLFFVLTCMAGLGELHKELESLEMRFKKLSQLWEGDGK